MRQWFALGSYRSWAIESDRLSVGRIAFAGSVL